MTAEVRLNGQQSTEARGVQGGWRRLSVVRHRENNVGIKGLNLSLQNPSACTDLSLIHI